MSDKEKEASHELHSQCDVLTGGKPVSTGSVPAD